MSENTEVILDLDGNEKAAEILMALPVHVSDQMGIIADELRTKPIVKNVSRGCDVRKYSDAFRFDGIAFYDFQAYVEAEMENGSLLCWLVDINCTPLGWEIDRTVNLIRNPRDDVINTFPVVCAPTLAEFAAKVSDALVELGEAARSFDFHEY